MYATIQLAMSELAEPDLAMPELAVPELTMPTPRAPTAASQPRPPSPETLPIDVLESEVVGLAGHLAAGHCRWLGLLAEFDTRQGWAGPGLRSCAHWLSWRVGMSLRAGYEQLRVAHALSALPALTDAFTAGRISYSKVRAITRVATPATEATLLDVALAGTASHVERVVRHTRQAGADPAAASARRELQWRWEDDGTLAVRGRFTAEQGALLIAAIAKTTETAEGNIHAGGAHEVRPAEHSDGSESSPVAARRADALVALIVGDRKVDAQLIVVVDAGSGAAAGFKSSANTGDGSSAGSGDGSSANSGDGSEAETGTAHIQGGPAVPMRTAERVGCNARVRALLRDQQGNPLRLGRSRRLASPAQVAALNIRDQGRCQFPGCDHTRHLEAHHIVHWLRGGRTDIDNLVLICGHHHDVIHDHGYRVRGRGTGVTFHRPDGRRIEPVGPPTSGSVDGLMAGHTGGPIDGETLTPTWAGERLDLSGILAELLPEDAWLAAA